MSKYWLLLWFAGLMEIGWVSGLKYATSFGEWTLTGIGLTISFCGLMFATQALPVGTAYAVFTGIGAAGTVLAESIFFDAPFHGDKMALVIVMAVGIAGLKMTSSPKSAENETEMETESERHAETVGIAGKEGEA